MCASCIDGVYRFDWSGIGGSNRIFKVSVKTNWEKVKEMVLGALRNLARRTIFSRHAPSACRLVSSKSENVVGESEAKKGEDSNLLEITSSGGGHRTQQETGAASASGPSQHNNKNNNNLEELILEASLPFVHQYGWSQASITAGAESAGYPGITHGMFPRGGFELVHYFYQKSNKKLVSHLVQQSDLFKSDPTLKKRESEIMEEALKMRLKMLEPFIGVWAEGLALMALPQNLTTSLANLLTLIDDIAYYAGDRSIDMNWYGKRLLLAGVYKATELYMVEDSSIDRVETWKFLERRMSELRQLHSCLANTEQASQFAQQFASAAFVTARNILGMNWRRYG